MSLYEVQYILARRNNQRTGELEYKVKWADYPRSQSTWQPLRHLQYIPQLIQEFDRHLDGLPRQSEPQVPLKIQQAAPLKQDSSLHLIKECSECHSSNSKSKGKSEGNRSRNSHKKIVRKNKAKMRQAFVESVETKNNTKIQNLMAEVEHNIASIAESVMDKKPHVNKSLDYTLPVLAQEDISMMSQYSESPPCAVEPSDYRIMDVSRNGSKLLYLVEDRNRPRWQTRNQVLRSHKQALLDFYEEHLLIIGNGSSE